MTMDDLVNEWELYRVEQSISSGYGYEAVFNFVCERLQGSPMTMRQVEDRAKALYARLNVLAGDPCAQEFEDERQQLRYMGAFLKAIIGIAEDKGVFTCPHDTPPEMTAYLRSFEDLSPGDPENYAAKGEQRVWAKLKSIAETWDRGMNCEEDTESGAGPFGG